MSAFQVLVAWIFLVSCIYTGNATVNKWLDVKTNGFLMTVEHHSATHCQTNTTDCWYPFIYFHHPVERLSARLADKRLEYGAMRLATENGVQEYPLDSHRVLWTNRDRSSWDWTDDHFNAVEYYFLFLSALLLNIFFIAAALSVGACIVLICI